MQYPYIKIYSHHFHHNIQTFIQKTKLHSLYIVAKSNGYGMGIENIALLAQHNQQVKGLCVINDQEALQARKAGFTKEILIIGYIQNYTEAIHQNFTCLIYDRALIPTMITAAQKMQKQIKVHLHCDTLFGRLGIQKHEVLELITIIQKTPELKLTGAMSHFSHSTDQLHSDRQYRIFTEISKALPSYLTKHMCSSHSAFLQPYAHHDTMRLGIGAYGFLPDLPKEQKSLKPIFSITLPILQKKHIPEGQPIGYGQTHITTKPTYIAIVPFGYNEGLSMQTNSLTAVAHTIPVTNIGAISMNVSAFDITHVPKKETLSFLTLFYPDHAHKASFLSYLQKQKQTAYEGIIRFPSSLKKIIIQT